MVDDPAIDSQKKALEYLLNDDQKRMFEQLLVELMAHGWGKIEIEVSNHTVRYIRMQESFSFGRID